MLTIEPKREATASELDIARLRRVTREALERAHYVLERTELLLLLSQLGRTESTKRMDGLPPSPWTE
jgi:hypothetical protein